MTKRLVLRVLRWQDFMKAHTDNDGVWWNSEPARKKLPDTKWLTDSTVKQFVLFMEREGFIERVAQGGYKVTAKRPRPIPTELMRPNKDRRNK